MADRFCTECGHRLEVDEHFCDACGHPVAADPAAPAIGSAGSAGPGADATAVQYAPPSAPAGGGGTGATVPPPSSAGEGPAGGDRRLWWAAIGIGAAILVVLVALLFSSLGDDDEVAVVPATMATTTSSTTSTSTSTTTTTTTVPTTTTSPVPPPFDPGADYDPDVGGFASAYEAVADWAWNTGLNYQGDCDFLDSTADYGAEPWCGTLWEQRGSVEVYRVADFPGGDFGYWVLVGSTEGGWNVMEVAEDLTGSPPF